MDVLATRLRRQAIAALCVASVAAMVPARLRAAGVERLPLAGSTFPIAAAVSVKAGTNLYFLSGSMGPTIDPAAPKGTPPKWGDTETQSFNALTALKGTLAKLGLGMGDVIKMNVFLVGDPAKGGKMDFPGMMAAYTKFFGTKEQPNLPARSAVQVAGLAAPGGLVEIEVIAAKTH
jgi:enamine deaminase RidA (YjgF/YER057c/UK114 family)